ncbi:MAG: thioesterase, partial [Gillisia sp.]|nr:thioesterase [Gillisia sp.]
MNYTPEIYEIGIKVTKEDLDELQHVNNVRYVQWIQDIA